MAGYDLGTARGKIELEYEGRRQAQEADRDMDRISDRARETDRALADLGGRMRAVFVTGLRGAGIAGLAVSIANGAIAAGNLTAQLAGVVPQLVSIGSLAAGLPAALTAGAAAVGTLKAAFAGVGDALTAAFDPEGAKKYAEALKQLSPEARKFAEAVKDSVPALKSYQQSIQDAFFSAAGLDKGVARGLSGLKQLGPLVKSLAADFGSLATRLANFATSQDSIEFIATSIQSMRNALDNASPALEPLLTGLRAVGFVGSELMERLGTAVGEVGRQFGEWLSDIADNGQLQTWIDTAITTLKTLGGIIGNVGSILNSLFGIANETSGGLLNTIQQLTGGFADFLKTAEGAEAVRSLFTALGTLAAQITPVITTLVGALAGALGPALAQIATDVGPVLLQVINELAPALAPLASALADIVSAVAPLAPPLAKIVSMFAQLAAGALTAIASEFGPLVEVISGGLTQALTTLQPVLGELLARGLPLAAEAGVALAQAFAPLVPLFVEFAGVLAQSLLDNMPQLFDIVQQLVPAMLNLANALSGNLGTALQALIPIIPQLVNAFVAFAQVFFSIQTTFLNVYAAILNFVSGIATIPGRVIAFVQAVGSAISTGFTNVVTFVQNAITSIVNFFTALPGRIGSALAALPGQVWNLITSTMTRAAFLFGQGIGILVSFAINFPRRVASAIAALPGQVANLAVRTWNGARNAFTAGINAVVGFAKALPGRVRAGINSLVSNVRATAVNAWNAARTAFSNGVNTVTGLARSLPGRIKSAVGNLGSLLAQAGRDAIAGLVGAIKNGVGAVGAAAKSLGSSVVAGIKSTLKISSPSRVMMQLGRYTVQGFAKGLEGSASQIKSASTKLSNMITDAFSKDANSKRKGIQHYFSAKTKNSVLNQLKKGTAQLLSLSKRSDVVAAKLKDAQQKLADVQKQYNDTYASAVSKTKESFQLVTPGQQYVNLDLTKERFQATVKQAQQFAKDIQALTKRGLNKDLLQQLVDAGAVDAGAMARALATASDKTIKEFNGLQGQLSGAANTVGKTTADALYGAGVKAAQGLVKGLQQQQAAIQKQMDKIADSMVARIKKALKIKSPSRIMFALGKFTTEGLIDGIRSLERQVALAAQRLATTSILPTVRLGLAPNATPNTGTRTFQPVTGTQTTLTQNVYALPGMSATQVAKYSLDRLRYGLMGGVSAAALPTPTPAGA